MIEIELIKNRDNTVKQKFPVENKYLGKKKRSKDYPYDNLHSESSISDPSEMENPVTRSNRLCTLGSRRKEKIRNTRETIVASHREQSYPWKRVS